MRYIVRIVAVVFSVVCGVGMAVVLIDRSALPHDVSLAPPWKSDTVSSSTDQPRFDAPPVHADPKKQPEFPRERPEPRDAVDVPPFATPPHPVVAPVDPPVANQVPAAEADIPLSGLLKILETVAPQISSSGAAAASPLQQPSLPSLLPNPEPTAPPGPPGPDASRLTKNDITHVPSETDPEGDNSLRFNVQNADIHDVLELLSTQAGLNIVASPNVQGAVNTTLNGVDVDTALDAILRQTGYVARRERDIIYVGTPEDVQQLDHFREPIVSRVFRPNYVTAAEIQNLVQPHLTPGVGQLSVTSAAKTGIESDPTSAGGDDFAEREAILVRDYESVIYEIEQIIAEIDKRPMQVAIEAMILSVNLEDEFEFGINWQLLRDRNHVRFGLGTPPTGLDAVDLNGGLTFAFLDSSLTNFVNALETIGETNVIATPRLMVLNKQRAEILIGAELGYVSTTVTETSTSQTVEFLEVGTQLRLRPFISSDGLIRMEVHPELSTGFVRVEDGISLPEKEVTQVTTNIMVRDGCTVIIGGLVREDLQTDVTQLPLLGNLPAIGALFRQKTEQIERREILVLITPNIVYEPDTCCEGDEAAREFHRRQAVISDHMSPLGKRRLARNLYRRALTAWSDGDARAAERLIRRSLQFDSMNRAAIDLQTEIHTATHAVPVVATAPIAGPVAPGESVDLWVLDELESPASRAPLNVHPRDEGSPGPHRQIAPRHPSNPDVTP